MEKKNLTKGFNGGQCVHISYIETIQDTPKYFEKIFVQEELGPDTK